MPPTQKQIADRLGIHQTLVAKALNGHPKVSEERRRLILKTAEEMGYGSHSNVAARTMRLRREGERMESGTVAVLMGTFLEGLPLPQLPFFRELLEGIHLATAQRDSHAAIYYIPGQGTLPRSVTEGGVDGVISLYSLTNEEKLDGVHLGSPVVRLGGATRQWNLRPDDEGAFFQITTHLLELGHTAIAYIGDTGTPSFLYSDGQRFAGFCNALAAAGVGLNPALLHHTVEPSFHSGHEAMTQMLQDGHAMTAVVCLNDATALGAIAAAREAGLSVPEDVSVTGFDGLSSGYGGSEELTTVYFDRVAMGRRAVEMIYQLDQVPGRELLPTQLRISRTTCPCLDAAHR